jgi:hypothetical protein
MFVRFRETQNSLQISLVETHRVYGKVRHEHVASLGSVPLAPTVADRVAFWVSLHERLAMLGNRLDGEAQARVLAAVHERVPMVTADEQRALQLAKAESEERFWAGMVDLNQATLAAAVAGKVGAPEAAAAAAAAEAAAVRDRIERIRRGEDVAGGLGQPMSREDAVRILRDARLTTADLAAMHWAAELAELAGEDGRDEAMDRISRDSTAKADRYRRNAVRRAVRALKERGE